MFGKTQDDVLRDFAHRVKDGEGMTLTILIHPHRYFNQACGGGAGYPISLRIIRDSDGCLVDSYWISTPIYEDTAIEKGQEIGRFLCGECDLSRDVVKLRRT